MEWKIRSADNRFERDFNHVVEGRLPLFGRAAFVVQEVIADRENRQRLNVRGGGVQIKRGTLHFHRQNSVRAKFFVERPLSVAEGAVHVVVVVVK